VQSDGEAVEESDPAQDRVPERSAPLSRGPISVFSTFWGPGEGKEGSPVLRARRAGPRNRRPRELIKLEPKTQGGSVPSDSDSVRMRTYTRKVAPAEGKPAFERFEDALRKVLPVPKKDVEKAALREKKAREAEGK
jgi:hypothetical protein